jgi:predicted RNase H-like HicB family nuclease
MEYTIILHPAEEGGYWVEVPALPGCLSQGETVEETLRNIKEAIESHLIAV